MSNIALEAKQREQIGQLQDRVNELEAEKADYKRALEWLIKRSNCCTNKCPDYFTDNCNYWENDNCMPYVLARAKAKKEGEEQ